MNIHCFHCLVILNGFIFACEWWNYLHIYRLSFARSSKLRKQHYNGRCPSLGASFRRPRRRPERTETRPTDCRRRWLTQREPSRSAVVCIVCRKIGKWINVIDAQHSKDQNKTPHWGSDSSECAKHWYVGGDAGWIIWSSGRKQRQSKSLRVKTFFEICTQHSKEENKTVNNTLRIWLFWMCRTLICWWESGLNYMKQLQKAKAK